MKAIEHIIFLTVALLAVSAAAEAADKPITLKNTFKDHFLVGAAVSRGMVTGGAGFRRSAEQTAKDIALLKEQFNQITAENDMKWALIHPREGADGYDFGPADAFVNFGLSNKMYVVGHTLVWHSQTPNWVFAGTNPPPPSPTNAAPAAPANTNAPATNRFGRGRFGPGFGGGFFGRYTGPRASREELLQRMREHVHTVVGRYKGKVQCWDVVNEAIADGDSTNVLRNSLWLEIIGPDFIAKVFQYAHEADPGAILRYNDYGLENPAKRKKLITLIRSLQAQKVPVHALGSQAHVPLQPDEQEQAMTSEEFESRLNRASEMELTFQAAATQGVQLTAEQSRRLESIAQKHEATYQEYRKHGITWRSLTAAQVEFEQRFTSALMLQQNLVAIEAHVAPASDPITQAHYEQARSEVLNRLKAQ